MLTLISQVNNMPSMKRYFSTWIFQVPFALRKVCEAVTQHTASAVYTVKSGEYTYIGSYIKNKCTAKTIQSLVIIGNHAVIAEK